MKKRKVTAVVAVRKGSERVKNKNIKNFDNTTLLELKLQILLRVKNIDEIIVNTDSDEMIMIASRFESVKTFKRPDYYGESEINNSEFHGYIGDATETDIILLSPVCSPFISVSMFEESIKLFLDNDFDSIISVNDIKGHLWLDEKPLNYILENVPNSQDLPDIYMLNYGITIIDRNILRNLRRVVGHKPYFLKTENYRSIDINTPYEFDLAELIYKYKKADLNLFG